MPETKMEREDKQACKATHEEICDGALRHYEKTSLEAHEWMNTVEKAIEFYKKHGEQALIQQPRKVGRGFFNKHANLLRSTMPPYIEYCLSEMLKELGELLDINIEVEE